MDAHVFPRGQPERHDLRSLADFLLAVGLQCAKLREDLLHLRHGACAVDELAARWVLELVGGDEREAGDGLAGAGGHLQAPVALRVQRALQLEHVPVLLGVEVLIREVDRQALEVEDHGSGPLGSCLRVTRLNGARNLVMIPVPKLRWRASPRLVLLSRWRSMPSRRDRGWVDAASRGIPSSPGNPAENPALRLS